MTAAKGSLYLWGGRGGKDMGTFSGDEDLWRMDTASETWESLATKGDKPEQRSFHVMTTSAVSILLAHEFGKLP
jgi:N-acetylneuraminic acid mutarotase